MSRLLRRLWPHSLTGQILLSMALALLLAQTISAVLLYKAEDKRHREMLTHQLAFRLFNAVHTRHSDSRPSAAGGGSFERAPPERTGPDLGIGIDTGPDRGPGASGPPSLFRPVTQAVFQPQPKDERDPLSEQELRRQFAEQEEKLDAIIIVRRAVGDDPVGRAAIAANERLFPHRPLKLADHVLIGAARITPGGPWLVARALPPPGEPRILSTLIAQTLFIYALLVGSMAAILRRIARPLAALTLRIEHFAQTRDPSGRLDPEGPADLRRLILAHNAMEARILALLDEKDVMLGAIGHDLKTPLAALRVRIESVEDDNERFRMAATIEDITRSLDDMLSLARVGRPTDPQEPTELSALVASVVEEYEDMGEAVELDHTQRLVVHLRPTWLRRALRNLIGNSLRYAGPVSVSLARETDQARRDWAVIRIGDTGPGIPEDQIAHMLEPFTRGEPSRNSETGGAGLGLTLARAIAEQHGGSLTLANRRDDRDAVTGLCAALRLPVG